ncbi:MAG: methylenetetrahydrofolate reductase C-terminal domain-containing protein [Thermodesulfobacteriota bacterium]
MIIAEWKPIAEIVARLEGCRNILVAGCATCVAECAAGGEREVESLAPLIQMALAQRGYPVEVLTATLERQCEPEFIEPLFPKMETVDAVVSIACGIGIQTLGDRFDPVPVYPGVNTTSLAVREQPGRWSVRCEACGSCVLGDTFGLCPIARCAKSLLNGPCGGTRENGTCEVNSDVDCIWLKIYERAMARGKLEALLGIQPTRNWSNSRHGGQKVMIREDLRP